MRYRQWEPQVDATAYVHPSAQLIGEVFLGPESSVWPGVVLRGDNGAIRLGARSNLQDGTIVHATLGFSQTTVAEETTVGHRVVLHGCTVATHCLIGIGAIILDGAEIGEWSFVAAGTLIPPNKKYPPRSFIMGSPGRVVREVGAKDLEAITHSYKVYQDLAKTYLSGG